MSNSANLWKSLPPEKDHGKQTEEQDEDRKAPEGGRTHLWAQTPSRGEKPEVTETQPQGQEEMFERRDAAPKEQEEMFERRSIITEIKDKTG